MTAALFRRLYLVSAAALLAAMLLTGVITYSRAQDAAREVLFAEARSAAAYADGGIEPGKAADGHRIQVAKADGTVLYDSEGSREADTLYGLEEFDAAIRNGSGSAVTRVGGRRQISCCVLTEGGSVVRVSGRAPGLSDIAAGVILPFLAAALMCVPAAYLVARRLAVRLRTYIARIDSDGADKAGYYPELEPLLGRLRRQNTFIRSHISELGRKQEEFGVITENMSEGFIVTNSAREILSYNSSAVRILGSGLAAGRPTVDALRHSEIFKGAVDTALEGRHNEQLMNIDGSFYRIIANPVCHDSEITGSVIVILDVTEKENREQMRREFTSNVSHELKTPLTSVRGAAELLSGGMVKPEDVPAFAGMIYSETGRLVTLIEDILRLSEFDEAGLQPEKTRVDLYEICASAVERLHSAAARLELTVTLEGEHTEIDGVPTMLDEMVFNLCDNAIKYNVPAGRVDVRVGRRDGSPFVSVADTGIGIPKEHLGRVFERFYRVDKSRSKAIGGTGLGLSIVKHAANNHGAQIELESEPGRGTTVTVVFG